MVLDLYVLYSIASGTSHLKAKIMGVVVPGPFGNSSLGNFQFGFWLGSFGAYVFFVGNGELRLMLAIWDGVW
jgi:hypothetical protein